MVPFGREIRLGNTCPDCKAVKRALARAGYGHPKTLVGLTAVFGKYAVTNLRHFQAAHGLGVDGVYGKATHAKLVPFFDAYGAHLYASYHTSTHSTRDRIAEAARYFVSIEPRVHYTQGPARMMIVREHLRPPVAEGKQVYEDCLAAGTLVTLRRGRVPIEEVRPGDMALTRSGYRRVLDAWLVKRNAEVVAVPLSDGGRLVGTPDHRVWTENRGWAAMRTLQPDDMLTGCEQASTAPMRRSSMRATVSIGTRTRSGARNASTTARGRQAPSIDSYGQRRTGRFLTDTTFITSTAILSTTVWKIWNYCRGANTSASTRRRGHYVSTPALGAERSSSLALALGGGIVSALAAALLPSTGSGTPSKRNALPAGRIFGRGSTARRDTARSVARRPVGRATPMGRSDVYDLTVEDEHEFFANGVLVHNCSSFAAGCYWIAGAPDPNGRGYDGAGYTGTLGVNGHPVSIREAKPADLVFYGLFPFHHVAVYIGNGLVISHGQESGPDVIPYNYRSDFHEIRSYV